ncbi:MAG: drug resistance transporter, EmrB/QacA subfamily [Eubacterium sp.]|jgi:EmrB/QacA subfamily drug resistance transporter|nr:drug resistance transporter, EmrB/QacA subfamily [Eubacterium sp.]
METVEKNNLNYALLMAALLIGGFFTTLATSTINIALPVLMEHFNTTLDTVKWSTTGFMLATGIMAPITCYMGEKFSYKRIYFISIIGFTISSIFCALSWNVQSLIAFRILQGLFNGLAVPSTMSIIYQIVPRNKQAFSMSLWSLSATVAPAIGPTLSGWLIQSFNWKAIFIMNIPIGIIAALFILKAVPYYKLNPPQGFDLPGFSTCLAASILLLTAFSEVSHWGWTSYKTILLLISGIVFLGIFIFRELTVKNPILNLSIFRFKGFTISVIIRSIVTMGLYAGSLLTPLFLQNAQHVSALDAGLILLPSSLAMALCTIIVGKLYNRIDQRILLIFGVICMAAGSFALSHLSLETSHIFVVICMTFRNAGIAFSLGTVTMLGMSSLDKKVSGNGSSINNWVAQSIGCLSIGIFTSLLTFQARQHAADLVNTGAALKMGKDLISNTSFVMGVNDVNFISAIIMLVALPLCFLLNKDKSGGEKLVQDENSKGLKGNLENLNSQPGFNSSVSENTI